MRNRFQLNEQEKNRIRGLHGINILNEGWPDIRLKFKAFGKNQEWRVEWPKLPEWLRKLFLKRWKKNKSKKFLRCSLTSCPDWDKESDETKSSEFSATESEGEELVGIAPGPEIEDVVNEQTDVKTDEDGDPITDVVDAGREIVSDVWDSFLSKLRDEWDNDTNGAWAIMVQKCENDGCRWDFVDKAKGLEGKCNCENQGVVDRIKAWWGDLWD